MSKNLINVGIQLVPLKIENAIFIIDVAIAIIKKHGYKTTVTPFETVVECTFEQSTKLLTDINNMCEKYNDLEWLLNVRYHCNAGADVIADDKTMKHK